MKKKLMQNFLVRIELKPNTSEVSEREGFIMYGILLLPTLIGYIIFYQGLQLREEYLICSLLLLIAVLGNLFFYYRSSLYRHYHLNLILCNGYVQFLDGKKTVVRMPLDQIETEIQWCKKSHCPAISLKHQNIPAILIGQKKGHKTIENDSIQNEICQPDYWLTNNGDWRTLIQVFKDSSSIVL